MRQAPCAISQVGLVPGISLDLNLVSIHSPFSMSCNHDVRLHINLSFADAIEQQAISPCR